MKLFENEFEQVIFTANPKFADIAKEEFLDYIVNSEFNEWLDDGVALVTVKDINFSDIAYELKSNYSLFIRHLAPAKVRVSCKNIEKFPDIVANAVKANKALIPADCKNIAIQVRVVQSEKQNISRSLIFKQVSEYLVSEGYSIEVKHPELILSVYITKGAAYLGVSNVESNLSSWAGGEYRFQKDPNQLSRAEFKLLEAFDIFSIFPESYKTALDLGASPGGWSRVLLNAGLKVVAVDPAKLDENLLKNSNIKHYRELAEDFFLDCNSRFDIIVNDMRMDIAFTVDVMLDAVPFLNKNGFAIVTFKLPARGEKGVALKNIKRLAKEYEICNVRSLFHNRQELTLHLQKKQSYNS